MELENIVRMVTQTQKDNSRCSLLFLDTNFKFLDLSTYPKAMKEEMDCRGGRRTGGSLDRRLVGCGYYKGGEKKH